MAANELGRRMDDDVSSILKWATQIGSCEGIVNNEWNTGLVGNVGDGADV